MNGKNSEALAAVLGVTVDDLRKMIAKFDDLRKEHPEGDPVGILAECHALVIENQG